MNFSKPVCFRLCRMLLLAVALCVIGWIYIFDPQPLTPLIVAKSVIAVVFLIAISAGVIWLFANSIERLLRVIREWKSGWQQRWIKKNMGVTNPKRKER